MGEKCRTRGLGLRRRKAGSDSRNGRRGRKANGGVGAGLGKSRTSGGDGTRKGGKEKARAKHEITHLQRLGTNESQMVREDGHRSKTMLARNVCQREVDEGVGGRA